MAWVGDAVCIFQWCFKNSSLCCDTSLIQEPAQCSHSKKIPPGFESFSGLSCRGKEPGRGCGGWVVDDSHLQRRPAFFWALQNHVYRCCTSKWIFRLDESNKWCWARKLARGSARARVHVRGRNLWKVLIRFRVLTDSDCPLLDANQKQSRVLCSDSQELELEEFYGQAQSTLEGTEGAKGSD